MSVAPTVPQTPRADLEAAPAARRGIDPCARTLASLALAVVVLVHVWVISAGWMTFWPRYTSDYSLQAQAFLHGQTSLLETPPPALLKLTDPYDPAANLPLRLHDASLFHGKYYLYWGPVPAILEMPFIALFHRPIGDQYLVFFFAFGLVFFSGQVLLSLREKFFPQAPHWTPALGILLVGLTTPMPFILARGAVYEAAILGGQCFLLAGIYLALTIFDDDRPALFRTILIGLCWALAVGSRVSLAPAIGALVLILAWQMIRRTARPSPDSLGFGSNPHRKDHREGAKTRRNTRELNCISFAPSRLRGKNSPDGRSPKQISDADRYSPLIRIAVLIAPLLLGAALLAYYNVARFGKWAEFGTRYQLASFNPSTYSNHMFAVSHLVPALYAYLLKPPILLKAFPFVQAVGGAATYPAWIHFPKDYETMEIVAGLAWCCPFLIFALAPLLTWRKNLPSNWICAALAVAGGVGILPAALSIASTMRYLADLTPTLTILALVGVWRLPPRWPAVRRYGLFVVLGVVSIIVGVLLGVIGYDGQFPMYHPHYLGL